MSKKTYLVQTWDKAGAKNNDYEVELEGSPAVLVKFLASKHGHVAVTPKATKPASKGSRR